MKFRAIFRFEVACQLRRWWTWLYFGAVVAFAANGIRKNYLADALYDDFYVNSPYVIGFVTVFSTLIWMLTAAPVAGDAAARDVERGMHPLLYTTPISRAEYLGGRFFAAFAINALLYLGVPVGIILAVYLPGVDAVAIGPFRPLAYLTAYAFIALPNAFVVTAIQFSLAALTRRSRASYLGSVLVFFLAYPLSVGIGIFGGMPDLAELTDPIGVVTITSDRALNWTSIEKSTRLIALEGTLLTNRLLWSGIAILLLVFTHARFRFEHPTPRRRWWMRRGKAQAPAPADRIAVTGAIVVPDVPRTFGFATHLRQMMAITAASFRAIAFSRTGFILWGVIAFFFAMVASLNMDDEGMPMLPRAEYLLTLLTTPLTNPFTPWVVLPLLILFYAGELIWREREAGLGEITDASSVPEWVPLAGKFLGLGLCIAALLTMLALAGVAVQLILGYPRFEIGLLLKTVVGLQLVEYLLFALLALVVHVVVNQKHVAQLIILVAYAFITLASMIGIEHKLLVFGASPGWSYTDMRGFGPSLGPWLWFKLYWAAWALLLAVFARLLWVRGTDGNLAVRLRIARRRLTRGTILAGATATALILALGGFIFYNTNVLNEYRPAAERSRRLAEYERRYARYARLPQPALTETKLHVELHPARHAVEVRGTYRLENRTAAPIGSIHLATAARDTTIRFDRPAAATLDDRDLGHRIYTLATPLQPGQALRLGFEVRSERKGFTNGGIDPSIAPNGTYFLHDAVLPVIGYQRMRELVKPGERRAQGLPARPLVPPLDDAEARRRPLEETAFDAVIGTEGDEIAVAPGALRRTWTEGGRRYAHYVTDAPISPGYAFLSARYTLREERWNGVTIRVFHHPGHAANVERMVRSARASLAYCSEQFAPYPYGHLTLVERAGTGRSWSAEASMIDYGEASTRLDPPDDPKELDLTFAVMSHEMAHQWWAGQLPYAEVEGAPIMSESLAWYAAMGVVEQARGAEQLWQLRAFMREPYPIPPIRQSVPLLRGLDPYASYRKGPFVMYALSHYLGRERVNGALRGLIARHRAGALPRATTRDLYGALQSVTPPQYRTLLHDLFAANTFWTLKTERVSAKKTAAGTWQVTLAIDARKEVVDVAGLETAVPMNDPIEIGVFAAPAKGERRGRPLHLAQHRIRSGRQNITVTVTGDPARAGIDPNYLLIEEKRIDNVRDVNG